MFKVKRIDSGHLRVDCDYAKWNGGVLVPLADARRLMADISRELTAIDPSPRPTPLQLAKRTAFFSAGPRKGAEASICPKTKIEYARRRDIAIDGPCILMAERDKFYGGEESDNYSSGVLRTPTWQVVFNHFIKSMAATRDYHHAFFEGVYIAPERMQHGDTPIYLFAVGS